MHSKIAKHPIYALSTWELRTSGSTKEKKISQELGQNNRCSVKKATLNPTIYIAVPHIEKIRNESRTNIRVSQVRAANCKKYCFCTYSGCVSCPTHIDKRTPRHPTPPFAYAYQLLKREESPVSKPTDSETLTENIGG